MFIFFIYKYFQLNITTITLDLHQMVFLKSHYDVWYTIISNLNISILQFFPVYFYKCKPLNFNRIEDLIKKTLFYLHCPGL